MFICAMIVQLRRVRARRQLSRELLALPAQVLRQFLEDVLEHEVRGRAAGLRSACRTTRLPSTPSATCCVELARAASLVLLLAPLAERDQVVLQPLDRIAERPVLVVVLRAGSATDRRWSNARAARYVTSSISVGPAPVRARCGGPLRDRVHREEIVAVDADAGACRSPGRAPRTSAARRRRSPGTWRSPTGC